MSLHNGNRRITKLVHNGVSARLLVKNGRQIWPCRNPYPLPQLEYRMDHDATGFWFEVGFRSPEALTGTAATGWTDPRGYCRLDLLASQNLTTWAEGLFVDCATTAIENPDGSWDYWSRATIPVYWQTLMVDLTATTTRGGKSITEVSVKQIPVTLPNYPYAMPADAATLQADLRAAGYPGATVTSTSADLTATARNHTVDGAFFINLTQSAGTITAVVYRGAALSLPNYPYILPGDQATLQADLRTAGLSGAVVMLHDDPWTITLPDRPAVGQERQFALTITPGDPFKQWNLFGVYLGEAPGNDIKGTSGNVRTPSGDPLLEADKQFARMRITRGTRVLP